MNTPIADMAIILAGGMASRYIGSGGKGSKVSATLNSEVTLLSNAISFAEEVFGVDNIGVSVRRSEDIEKFGLNEPIPAGDANVIVRHDDMTKPRGPAAGVWPFKEMLKGMGSKNVVILFGDNTYFNWPLWKRTVNQMKLMQEHNHVFVSGKTTNDHGEAARLAYIAPGMTHGVDHVEALVQPPHDQWHDLTVRGKEFFIGFIMMPATILAEALELAMKATEHPAIATGGDGEEFLITEVVNAALALVSTKSTSVRIQRDYGLIDVATISDLTHARRLYKTQRID